MEQQQPQQERQAWQIMADLHMLRTCAACGRQAPRLPKCAGCRGVHYCDAACQANHWWHHRDNCGPNKRFRPDPNPEQGPGGGAPVQ